MSLSFHSEGHSCLKMGSAVSDLINNGPDGVYRIICRGVGFIIASEVLYYC